MSSGSKPLNRSVTCQTVYEHISVERCRSLSVNRRSSEGAESRNSRSNSRMIMVMPAENRSQISLPRSSTDSAISDVQRKEKEVFSDSDDELEEYQMLPMTKLNKAAVLPFMFLGERDSVSDTRFLCDNRIWTIANLSNEKIEHMRIHCVCERSQTPSHVIKEISLPVQKDMSIKEYLEMFREFNSAVSRLRGSDKKILVYSNSTQLNLLFATQFMMSHYKNVELRRAKHQLEKNLRGILVLSPLFLNILEHYEQILVTGKEKVNIQKIAVEPVYEDRVSTSSSTGVSSAGSTPKSITRMRHGSLPRIAKLAWPSVS